MVVGSRQPQTAMTIARLAWGVPRSGGLVGSDLLAIWKHTLRRGT